MDPTTTTTAPILAISLVSTRPTSITVIAWFLIVSCGLSVVTSTLMIGNPTVDELMAKSPVPASWQYALMYVGTGIGFTCGYFFLKGKRWARSLYVCWTSFSLLFGLITSPIKITLLPSAVLLMVFAVLLYRPRANAFFSRPES